MLPPYFFLGPAVAPTFLILESPQVYMAQTFYRFETLHYLCVHMAAQLQAHKNKGLLSVKFS